MPAPHPDSVDQAVARIVRRHDPDRYFTGLFAPAPRRGALFTLYAFNHETARARDVAREPAMALIRLQWWREVVEGGVRPHEVATPLHAALAAGLLAQADLQTMLDAREREVEGGFATLAEWRAWLLQGAGSLAVAAGRLLGAGGGDLGRLRALGAGAGAGGILRNLPFLAHTGRCLLPADLLTRHGTDAERLLEDPGAASLAPLRAEVAAEGLRMLGAPQPGARAWMAAGLPAVLARRDLRRPQRAAIPHGLPDRLAVAMAALRARF